MHLHYILLYMRVCIHTTTQTYIDRYVFFPREKDRRTDTV